jgi:hypothetical protein
MCAVFAPNMFDVLAFTTALTVPFASEIFPAALYRRQLQEQGRNRPPPAHTIWPSSKRTAAAVGVVGWMSFATCMYGAIGQIAIEGLRGDSTIGCPGWFT